jgi:hypothetical protein|tara:strand:- start:486 stop:686 length:201 start_codon:yes stop_codon:yes gene_type:complete
MYCTKVTCNGEEIASTYTDLLSQAVDFGNKVSFTGDTITVYEATKNLCDVELTHQVLSCQVFDNEL